MTTEIVPYAPSPTVSTSAAADVAERQEKAASAARAVIWLAGAAFGLSMSVLLLSVWAALVVATSLGPVTLVWLFGAVFMVLLVLAVGMRLSVQWIERR